MTTDISVRYDPISQTETNEEYDGGNSSSRLFERARIRALAGMCHLMPADLALSSKSTNLFTFSLFR